VAPEYRIELYSADNVKFAEITDYVGLGYTRKRNGPGTLLLDMPSGHAQLAALTNLRPVQVWRRDKAAGIEWYRDWFGIIRDTEVTFNDFEQIRYTAIDRFAQLAWRYNLYFASTANRTVFTATPVQTIIYLLATYNFTGSATVANGRVRNASLSWMSVPASAGLGPTIDRANAFANVMTEIQDLCKIDNAEVRMEHLTPTTAQITYYAAPNGAGTNRAATVIFSIERDNILNYKQSQKHTAEKTVAIVGGKGTESNRQFAVATGSNYSAGSNDVEIFVNAGNKPTAELATIATKTVTDLRARKVIDFAPKTGGPFLYGRDYYLSDIVTGRIRGVDTQRRIDGVNVEFRPNGEETIKLTLSEV
jgi:hypothetical protein